MMKKNGFTLAEVLITLAIIGVVATMTLPSLMTNTAEQQAKSALKKGINTLTEAAQMSQALDGYDYASLNETTIDNEAQSLYGLLARRTAIDFGKSGAYNAEARRGITSYGTTANYVVYFRDGSSLSFPTSANSTFQSGAIAANQMQGDGLPYGITALYDTNGVKGPNMVSNCSSATTGLASGSDSTVGDHNTACRGTARVIKDQFGVRLRGGFAVPNGAAARWAFEN